MVSFIDGLTSGLKAAYCADVSRDPDFLSGLRDVLIPGPIAARADRLNRWICDTPPDEPPVVAPPFTGGQCPETYIAMVQQVESDGSFFFPPSPFRILGPVSGIVTTTGGGSPPLISYFLRGHSAAAGTDVCATLTDTGVTDTFIASARFESFVVTSVVPCGSDDCGDPPIVLPPAAPVTVDVDVTYNDGDDNEYNLTIPTIFAPVYVGIDGTLNIPINIPAINFNGTINLDNNFEISPNFGAGDEPTGTSDDPGLPDTGNPVNTPPVEPNGPESKIIGVHVRTSIIGEPNATAIFQAGAPEISAPRCANVVFGVQLGSLTGWTSDIPVKNLRSYLPCPVPQGAVDVKVTAEPGYSVSFTPVRGRPLSPYEP